MNSIDTVVAAAIAQIEACHAAREQALTLARALTRQCANTIRAAHRRDFAEAAALLAEAGASARALRESLARHPDLLYAGYSQDALKEYAEAALVYAFLRGDPPPDAESLGVDAAAYLNGLAEAASELRRAVLDNLRTGATARGVELLSMMEDIYSLLITVDYPEAVTGGLRRTTDALRAVLERTRGDVTAAIRQDQLIAALEAFERRLDQHVAANPGSLRNPLSSGPSGGS
ncbi:MAG: haloacid dehalogenase [Roseiflexus sp.]|nr:haloacid dehalogenase [Roseiflexus sp.]MCS7290233.1 haloacid dehalogenase [Roseiflexus sp.]MDW8147993.1 haloacid dehalogenase [Roseiflexaceae bacterium]MDW8233743.1 haloacid dehalogenase [Roseiflexaceae bacterium]